MTRFIALASGVLTVLSIVFSEPNALAARGRAPASRTPASYDVRLEVAQGATPANFSHLVLRSGQTETVIQPGLTETTFYDVKFESKGGSPEIVQMTVVTGRMGPAGERIVTSNSRIISRMDTPARLLSESDDGSSVSIFATASAHP